MKKGNWFVLLSGAAVGLTAVLLTALGNPANMGFCIACFLRDIAGACGMHSAAAVQYFRPEIPGLVLGACLMSMVSGEFRAKAGSAPAIRFVLGALVMMGALVFLGCPLRMVLRLAGGDLNGLTALFGFAAGIFIGTRFLNGGFSLKRAYDASKAEGYVLSVGLTLLLVLFLLVPGLFKISEKGPGSLRAPVLIAFFLALAVGALAQKSRLCMAGGIRDGIMFRDFTLLQGFGAIFIVALVGNLVTGNFRVGFLSQPVAHSAHLWNFLGMVIVGWGSVLLGGCPLRQLILAGSGNGDCAVTVFGMMAGAALAHNFGLAGAADSLQEGTYLVGGIQSQGQWAVAIGLGLLLVISLVHLPKKVNISGGKNHG